MKKLLIKIFIIMISKNESLYNEFLSDLIKRDKAEFIKKTIGYDNILIRKNINNEKIDKIENCIIIQTKFEECVINDITRNVCKETIISCNTINKLNN